MTIRLRARAAIAAVVAAGLTLAACGGSDEGGDSSGGEALSGAVVIDGSSTVEPLSSAAAELFMEQNPDTNVTVGTSGTGGGFKKFCAGETDISDASRPIKDEEIAICEEKGIAYTELIVANDALSVVVTGGRRTDPRSAVFASALWLCLTVACVFLLIVLAVIVAEGWHRFDADLVGNQPSRLRPETAGVQSAIFGTLWVMGGTIVLALPLGIGAAIYLEEYADNTKWWNKLIELNIQNLVAVPSIIYGILTLAFVVRGPISVGAVIIAGSVALALLILPVVHRPYPAARLLALLRYFAERPGAVLTRKELNRAVWGDKLGVQSNSLTVHVARLRKRLGDNEHDPQWTKAIRGLGYQFAVPSTSDVASPAPPSPRSPDVHTV